MPFTHHIPFSKISLSSEWSRFIFLPPPLAVPRKTRRILAPDQELNLCPLQWMCGTLTTGSPGNSLNCFLGQDPARSSRELASLLSLLKEDEVERD